VEVSTLPQLPLVVRVESLCCAERLTGAGSVSKDFGVAEPRR
jgi:hypothetical protein